MEEKVKFETHYKYDGVSGKELIGYSHIKAQSPCIDLVCRRCVPFVPWIFTHGGKEIVINADSSESLVRQLRNYFGIDANTVLRIAFSHDKSFEINSIRNSEEKSLVQQLEDQNVECYSLNKFSHVV